MNFLKTNSTDDVMGVGRALAVVCEGTVAAETAAVEGDIMSSDQGWDD